MSKNQTDKLTYIKWTDAINNDAGWYDRETAIDWAEQSYWHVESVGWIIKETKKYILFCSRLGLINTKTPKYGELFKIPKPWILERKELK